jgi:hypothetical protein
VPSRPDAIDRLVDGGRIAHPHREPRDGAGPGRLAVEVGEERRGVDHQPDAGVVLRLEVRVVDPGLREPEAEQLV